MNNKVYIKFVLKKSDFMRPEADKCILNLWYNQHTEVLHITVLFLCILKAY